MTLRTVLLARPELLTLYIFTEQWMTNKIQRYSVVGIEGFDKLVFQPLKLFRDEGN